MSLVGPLQGMSANFGVMLNAVSAVNAVAIMGLADEYVNYIMRAFELEDGTPVVRGLARMTCCPKARWAFSAYVSVCCGNVLSWCWPVSSP